MRSWTYVWRQQLKVWLPPLVLVLVALAPALFYRLALAGEAEFRQAGFQQRASDLVKLRADRERLEEFVAQVGSGRADVDGFFGERLGTEEQQLTAVISWIKKQARRSGMMPGVINYEREVVEEQQVLRRSLVFTVEGDYLSLRKLLNAFELSEFFITVEEVTLRGGEGGTLRINLRIATYFIAEGAPDPAMEGA